MWLSQSTCLTTPILPPLPQSVPPRPSSVRPPPPPLLHPFLAALHPSTGQTFFLAVSHLSFTFYLSVPSFPGFPPSLQLFSFTHPSFPELLNYFTVFPRFIVASSSASSGFLLYLHDKYTPCKQTGRVAPTTKPFSHLSHIHHFNPPVKLISYFPLLLFWFPLSFLCNNACMWYMIKSYT